MFRNALNTDNSSFKIMFISVKLSMISTYICNIHFKLLKQRNVVSTRLIFSLIDYLTVFAEIDDRHVKYFVNNNYNLGKSVLLYVV